MAIQQIKKKRIIKYDTTNPNFIEKPKPKVEVNGNKEVEGKKSPYDEGKYYTKNENGNLQMEDMMGKLMNKLDNFGSKSQTGIKAVDVDIKREISIGKVDKNAVKSETTTNNIKSKKDKLKALRHKRLYNKQMGSK